jgi:antagonist of KipI
MSLLVTKEGLLTTVQDLGRYGYRSFGVNPSGVMDRTAARLLNLLLDNDENAPVLELHFPAGEFTFENATSFAVGGGDFSAELSGRSIANWSTQWANKDDNLRFTRTRSGNRAYLAVGTGFNVEPWLGSASTSLVTATGGFQGRRLRVGDRIRFTSVVKKPSDPKKRIGDSLLRNYSPAPRLRITGGPEFDTLTGISQHEFLSCQFAISPHSDRMGFRLQGPSLYRLSETEMHSSGTTFGTIQLLPDGQMIVLMADHQTTGGYPRIATVSSVDLPLMAQLGPADIVSFELIDQVEAERLAIKLERDIAFFKTGLRVRNGSL